MPARPQWCVSMSCVRVCMAEQAPHTPTSETGPRDKRGEMRETRHRDVVVRASVVCWADSRVDASHACAGLQLLVEVAGERKLSCLSFLRDDKFMAAVIGAHVSVQLEARTMVVARLAPVHVGCNRDWRWLGSRLPFNGKCQIHACWLCSHRKLPTPKPRETRALMPWQPA